MICQPAYRSKMNLLFFFLNQKELSMKRASFSLALGFLLLALGFSHAQDREFKGYITDDMCGRKHMMESVTAKECADQCVVAGAKYALFVPDDEKMYVVEDQDKAGEYSGENVVAKGSVSEDGKTIRLTSIAKQE